VLLPGPGAARCAPGTLYKEIVLAGALAIRSSSAWERVCEQIRGGSAGGENILIVVPELVVALEGIGNDQLCTKAPASQR
jgi:hypothetical protein